MVYYESIKITIDVVDLVMIILNVVMRYHSLSNSIVSDWDLVFNSKFWSLLYYFLGD